METRRLNEAVAPKDFRKGEQYSDLERNGVVGSCSTRRAHFGKCMVRTYHHGFFGDSDSF